LPFVDGNELVWKNNHLQVKNSEIEIIAFDSSYTIVKFKTYFDEVIELDNF